MIAWLLLGPVALGADETEPVQKPEVRVGDAWTYRYTAYLSNLPRISSGEMRVAFADPATIVVVLADSGGREVDTHWTSEWGAMASFDGRIYDPPQRLLQFPLQVGATYAYAYGIVARRGSTMRTRSEGTASVVGWEDIVVPAGKFRALKVEVRGTIQRLDVNLAGWQRWDIWYVPEAKRWVKFAYEYGRVGRSSAPDERTAHELVAFKVQ